MLEEISNSSLSTSISEKKFIINNSIWLIIGVTSINHIVTHACKSSSKPLKKPTIGDNSKHPIHFLEKIPA
ncbi:hypothetical protein L3X38_042826 [Prunus dulcis]|uniref:Uncharacterized protein n=1 Tax=Prunus dulcis TaxID=3755 RepID=A0AAD4UVA5_PRUDU|nr:hypothetical protein L3X38_042826 [Prunus dulcis]